MADVHEAGVRSYNMIRIRSKNTKPELIVRKYLFANGFRYRIHDKRLPGKPDIVLPKYKSVIFVHGCFWHGHEGCKNFVVPKTRTEFWKKKISRNKHLDMENVIKIGALNWRIITIFECELNDEKRVNNLNRIINQLKNLYNAD